MSHAPPSKAELDGSRPVGLWVPGNIEGFADKRKHKSVRLLGTAQVLPRAPLSAVSAQMPPPPWIVRPDPPRKMAAAASADVRIQFHAGLQTGDAVRRSDNLSRSLISRIPWGTNPF